MVYTLWVMVIHCPEDISDKDLLLKFIHDFDKKASSAGRVLHFSDFDNHGVHRKKELNHIIENALAENRFEVYYQPIYSIKEECFTSAEALIRLHDEQYGFIPPDEFIPVAEENMSILIIGRFVLETVCNFIASGRLKELGIKYIEVNLSVVQCMQTDMAGQILEIVNRYGIDPGQLNLEITETATLYSPETMLHNMETLNKNGIRFSLDDYGSGYATLSYLLNFPFSLIKLDRGIICAHDGEPQKWIALKYTMEMLLEMGYEIVAEGTETKEIVEDLSRRGCHYLQGYYFSKAIPAATFLEYITCHNLNV